MLTGLLFMTTAWSYAEATTMLPEAGGSSSFARRAFNEFVSFGAGWGLMLDYIITIAISAFFVPNYLAAFWPILKMWPYNSIGGILVIVFLVTINVIGIKEAARLNIVLAVLDLATQTLLMVVGLVAALHADHPHRPDPPRRGAHLEAAHLRHLHRHGRLHRHRDRLQHGRGGRQPGQGRSQSRQLVLAAVLAVYAGMSLTASRPCRSSPTCCPSTRKHGMTLPVAVVQPDRRTSPTPVPSSRAIRRSEVYVPVTKTPAAAPPA